MDCFPVQEEQLMHRFYADPVRSTDDQVFLTPEDARHALSVLRLKEGQHIEIIRDGTRFDAEITGADSLNVSASASCTSLSIIRLITTECQAVSAAAAVLQNVR